MNHIIAQLLRFLPPPLFRMFNLSPSYLMLSLDTQALKHAPPSYTEESILQMNRNGRVPTRANHGARPCSSVMRRLRVKESYKRWKPSLSPDEEGYDHQHQDLDFIRGNAQDTETETKEKPAEGGTPPAGGATPQAGGAGAAGGAAPKKEEKK